MTRDGWVPKRLDNGRSLAAASPGELHALITADGAAPTPRALLADPAGRAS